MKLHILLSIMVARTVCQPVTDHDKNLGADKGSSKGIDADDLDENARTIQFGERLSGRKVQSDAIRQTTEEAHGDPTKGEEIRSKRGHNQRITRLNTSHFVIGGHAGSIYSTSSSHNLHRVAGISNKGSFSHSSIGNTHGVVIPILGVTSGQASSGPFINYGSATLTRSGPRRHPSGSTSGKHVSHGNNHHNAGMKDPETIKRLISNGGYSAASLSSMKTVDSAMLRNLLGDGYNKNGPYGHSDGYSPGTGYYYGK